MCTFIVSHDNKFVVLPSVIVNFYRTWGQYDHLDARTTMTVMTNIMTVVMTNMIEWRMMITNMSMQHPSHVNGREQEMWTMSIDDRRGHSLPTLVYPMLFL
jgi:hypothetical protein